MSAGNMGLLEYGADALISLGPDTEQAAAAAACVTAHAVSVEDAEVLLEILGLDVAAFLRCPVCGKPPESIVHAVLCEPQVTADRIHLLAGSVAA